VVKDFAVYTVMRVLLFVGAFALVAAVWALVTGEGVPIAPALIVALLLSGVASFVLLDSPRAKLAHRIEQRFERMKTKEDVD